MIVFLEDELKDHRIAYIYELLKDLGFQILILEEKTTKDLDKFIFVTKTCRKKKNHYSKGNWKFSKKRDEANYICCLDGAELDDEFFLRDFYDKFQRIARKIRVRNEITFMFANKHFKKIVQR